MVTSGTAFRRQIVIYVNGSSKGNPGPSAVGVVIVDEQGGVLEERALYLGDNYTNQDAELLAILHGLELAPNHCTIAADICSDSQLAVRQLNFQFRIHKDKHRRIHEQIRHAAAVMNLVRYIKVDREHPMIKGADSLATQKINETLYGTRAKNAPFRPAAANRRRGLGENRPQVLIGAQVMCRRRCSTWSPVLQ